MLSKTYSSQLTGLHSEIITIEVDLTRGKPQLIIIGLAAKEISESKERITSALLNCGITPKAKKTIVNLAPAGVKKSGSKFDLAIIIAILQSYKILPKPQKPTAFFGEIALDGSVRKISGVLPLTLAAKKQGFTQIVIPETNEFEARCIDGIQIFTLSHLSEILNSKHVKNLPGVKYSENNLKPRINEVSIDAIYGQEEAKRAVEIAAAGGHNLHLTGPPGSGKSMVAKSISSVLPNLSRKEILEVNSIHSIAGKIHSALLTSPPVRAPLPGLSATALLGGGQKLSPGEISLAHRGVLFLDEITEYPKKVLESLRIPLENKVVTITRQSGTMTYPANSILICASNPCACGYYQSTIKPCSCPRTVLKKYKNKLSGPLRDRIDLQVFMTPIRTEKFNKKNYQNNFRKVKKRVAAARQTQKNRYKGYEYSLNAELSSAGVKKHLLLNEKSKLFLQQAIIRYSLSTRGYFAILKVAQTIADLEQVEKIQIKHIAEALQFRNQERKY